MKYAIVKKLVENRMSDSPIQQDAIADHEYDILPDAGDGTTPNDESFFSGKVKLANGKRIADNDEENDLPANVEISHTESVKLQAIASLVEKGKPISLSMIKDFPEEIYEQLLPLVELSNQKLSQHLRKKRLGEENINESYENKLRVSEYKLVYKHIDNAITLLDKVMRIAETIQEYTYITKTDNKLGKVYKNTINALEGYRDLDKAFKAHQKKSK